MAFLEDAGYTITQAGDGMEGMVAFHKGDFDLVLLDIMIPKLDGDVVCEMIRSESSIPVILLTTLDDEESQMKGFDLMADDYITKPFSMPLVLRRIEAVLRRTQNQEEDENLLSYREIQLYTDNYKVFVAGNEITLTAREFEILRLFLENKGRVFTRAQQLDRVWNYDYVGDDKIINTHIKTGVEKSTSLMSDFCARYKASINITDDSGTTIFSKDKTGSARQNDKFIYTEEITQFTRNEKIYSIEINRMKTIQVKAVILGLIPHISVIVILLSAIGAYIITHYFSKPIREIAETATKMGNMDLSSRCNCARTDEIGHLAKNLNDMADHLNTALKGLTFLLLCPMN